MSIIKSLRNYLAAYSALPSGAPLWADYLGKEPGQYAIVPMPGARVIDEYLDGGSLREYPFAFQAMLSTSADAERLESNGFFETFADWLESQTKAGVLPVLGTKKKATEIKALSWGYLFEQGDSGTGIYQIQCKLEYEQEA